MSRQRTIFGKLAPPTTYYKHPPKTLYEQFVEACYFFKSSKLTKEEFIKEANKLWNENKDNMQYVNDIIQKRKNKLSGQSGNAIPAKSSKRQIHKTTVSSDTSRTPKSSQSFCNDRNQLPSTDPNRKVHLAPDSPRYSIISEFLDHITPGLSKAISSFNDIELLIRAIHETAKSYNGISKQLDTVKTSTIRQPKNKISQLQLDIQDLQQSLCDFGANLTRLSLIVIEPSLGFGLLEQKLMQHRELMNICLQGALKIENLISEKCLKYSLNRRVKQIQDREAKLLADDTIDLKIFAKAGIERTWGEGLNDLCNELIDKRPDLGLTQTELLHLAFLLQSSAVVPTKMVFDMFPSMDSRFKKQNILNCFLRSLPLYVLILKTKEYLINFCQTNCGEVIDKIISAQQKDTTQEENSGDVPKPLEKATVHKKKGQPSIVSKFPTIPDEITKFIKTNGFKAQEKRRDDDFRSCGVSLNDIRDHLLKVVPGLAEHGIAPNTIRYLFVPVHKSRSSSKRYLGIVPCKVPKKDNSGRTENENNHFIHSRVGMRFEHAATYNKDYSMISADAMNKIHVGTLAVSRYL
eukprot:TCONS_00065867-protein